MWTFLRVAFVGSRDSTSEDVSGSKLGMLLLSSGRGFHGFGSNNLRCADRLVLIVT